MIIDSARLAFSQMLSKPHRGFLWRSLLYTVLILLAMWLTLSELVSAFITPGLTGWPWIAALITWALGAGMFIGAVFLMAPVTAIMAGLFLDDVAEKVERNDYPDDAPGRSLPLNQSIWLSFKFTLFVLAANAFTLVLTLLPGINFIAFFGLNGYLLGREYFQFAAMRHRSYADAKSLRRNHEGSIFLAGLIIAGVMSVPFLNLTTPIFAAIMMVHLHKRLSFDPGSQAASSAMRRAA